MSDGDMQRKPKMEDSSLSPREKYLTASVKIKIAHEGHGMSHPMFESSTYPKVEDIKQFL
jgi:hypothetical protein